MRRPHEVLPHDVQHRRPLPARQRRHRPRGQRRHRQARCATPTSGDDAASAAGARRPRTSASHRARRSPPTWRRRRCFRAARRPMRADRHGDRPAEEHRQRAHEQRHRRPRAQLVGDRLAVDRADAELAARGAPQPLAVAGLGHDRERPLGPVERARSPVAGRTTTPASRPRRDAPRRRSRRASTTGPRSAAWCARRVRRASVDAVVRSCASPRTSSGSAKVSSATRSRSRRSLPCSMSRATARLADGRVKSSARSSQKRVQKSAAASRLGQVVRVAPVRPIRSPTGASATATRPRRVGRQRFEQRKHVRERRAPEAPEDARRRVPLGVAGRRCAASASPARERTSGGRALKNAAGRESARAAPRSKSSSVAGSCSRRRRRIRRERRHEKEHEAGGQQGGDRPQQPAQRVAEHRLVVIARETPCARGLARSIRPRYERGRPACARRALDRGRPGPGGAGRAGRAVRRLPAVGEADASHDSVVADLADRFAGTLEFGTAGLRGVLGGRSEPDEPRGRRAGHAGRSRGSSSRRSRRALARRSSSGGDARRMSREFAEDAARILAGAGLRVVLFRSPVPTPLVGVRGEAPRARRAGSSSPRATTRPSTTATRCTGRTRRRSSRRSTRASPPRSSARRPRGASRAPRPKCSAREARSSTRPKSWRATISRRPRARGAPADAGDRALPHRLHAAPRRRRRARRARRSRARASPTSTCVPEQQKPRRRVPHRGVPEPRGAGRDGPRRSRSRRSARRALVLANDPDADRLAVAVPDPGASVGLPPAHGQRGRRPPRALPPHRAAGRRGPRAVLATIVSSPLLGRIARGSRRPLRGDADGLQVDRRPRHGARAAKGASSSSATKRRSGTASGASSATRTASPRRALAAEVAAVLACARADDRRRSSTRSPAAGVSS